MARRARTGAMAHAAAGCLACAPVLLFPLLSTYFHTTLALHLSVLAAYAALRGMVSTRWAASAGILVAFVALTKQSIGVAIALGTLACMFSQASPDRRIRQCLWLLAGGSASTLVTLLVFGARGDLGALVHHHAPDGGAQYRRARWPPACAHFHHREYGRAQAGRVRSHQNLQGAHLQGRKDYPDQEEVGVRGLF